MYSILKWVIPASKGEFGRMKIRFIFIFSAFLMVINHRIIRHYYVLKSQPFTVFKEWFTSCSTWPLCFDYKTHKTQQKRIFSSSWTLVPSSSFAKTSLPVTTTVVSSHTWEGCTLASFASTAAWLSLFPSWKITAHAALKSETPEFKNDFKPWLK